jgi:heat shock protein HslJ
VRLQVNPRHKDRVMSKSLALALALSAFACSSKPASDAPPTAAAPTAPAPAPAASIDGTWQLVELTAIPGAPPAPVALTIAGASMNGSTGCNHLEATIAGAGLDARITVGAVTERGCDDPRGAFETAYLKTLAGVAGYRLDGGALVLLDGQGGVAARFAAAAVPARAAAPTPAAAGGADVANTTWRITGYADRAGKLGGGAHAARMTLGFADDSLTGHAVCNSFNGRYARRGDTAVALTIGGVTELACGGAADAMDAEGAYLRALAKVASFRRAGDALELLAADGAVVVTATRAP